GASSPSTGPFDAGPPARDRPACHRPTRRGFLIPEPAMSTSVPQSPPAASTPQAGHLPDPGQQAAPPRAIPLRPAPGITAAAGLPVLAVVLVSRWWQARTALSVTDDAFVEAHIVNVAPEVVSGRIVRLLVDEDDRVERGQVLAEVDPVPYRDKVNLAASKLEAPRRELARRQADLARLRREVPIQIEIARRTLASAEADRARAESSLELTEDNVEKAIDEARAARKAANADLVLAQADHGRIANLERKGSSTRH